MGSQLTLNDSTRFGAPTCCVHVLVKVGDAVLGSVLADAMAFSALERRAPVHGDRGAASEQQQMVKNKVLQKAGIALGLPDVILYERDWCRGRIQAAHGDGTYDVLYVLRLKTSLIQSAL